MKDARIADQHFQYSLLSGVEKGRFILYLNMDSTVSDGKLMAAGFLSEKNKVAI